MVRVVLVFCLASLLSACAPVAPWQRAHLAEPTMALNSSPLVSSMREHHYGSREGAVNSHSTGGGGCGCY
jgi:hypothetical protein